jgi:hypothetical protein
MTDALETLARDHDLFAEQSDFGCTQPCTCGDCQLMRAHRAAAAACREAIARRTDPETMGHETMHTRHTAKTTDAALAAFMEGR